MKKLKNWKDVQKEFEKGFTDDELDEIKLEEQIILATIDARQKAKITQKELSIKSGIKQPNIAKIENFVRTPQYTTLMRLLRPLGYTLKVVPLEKIKK